MMALQRLPMPLYALLAGAKSSAGRRNPNHQRRNSAPLTALFLCSSVMAAVRGQASAWPGSFGAGIPTPRTVATQSRRKDRGDSNTKGVSPMATRLNTFITRSLESRASAHRAMAKSALFANSSTRTRLKRYNHHIDKAQQLEARLADTATRSAGGVA